MFVMLYLCLSLPVSHPHDFLLPTNIDNTTPETWYKAFKIEQAENSLYTYPINTANNFHENTKENISFYNIMLINTDHLNSQPIPFRIKKNVGKQILHKYIYETLLAGD